jgi:two-component system sensor histidine kinase/response regulator
MKELPSVLVVDDNPANLGLLFDLLDEAEFEVLVAQNGESAIKRAQNAHPDIILLDVMMPGMDGFETCEQLKTDETTTDIPIIFMTALANIDDKMKGFTLGAVDYITKPIQPEEVMARIKTHLTIQALQRDLRKKNEELSASLLREKELNQLKSRFISMVSHEFKTPLTTILLSSNLLQRYGERMPVEKRVEELQVIERTVNHLNSLLENVLTVTKGQVGKIEFRPELTDVQQLCQKLIERFRAMSEETHSIEFSHVGDRLQASVDPKLLEHILSNLLSNAIKYSPTGSGVFFEFSGNNNELVFQIKDEGIGISEADQHHLFDPFHRGENVGTIKGTGLGLSIVKQFVELHDGRISVESELGKGTTFTVVIPFHN